MKYRVATPAEWPGITECIGSTGYYLPTHAATLDGLTIVAMDHDKVVGCLWAMVCGRHAYLDYFCVLPGTPGIVAAKLSMHMEAYLKRIGVQWIRASIKTDNAPALRVSQAAGMMYDHGYTMVVKEISDGLENNVPNHINNDSQEVVPGTEVDGSVRGDSLPGGSGPGEPRLELPSEWRGVDADPV